MIHEGGHLNPRASSLGRSPQSSTGFGPR
jgi:hypothetical protein